ncbi:hypothetical protein C7N43_05125, partial [Sphingobacteriales bacterium UPWRP_1]
DLTPLTTGNTQTTTCANAGQYFTVQVCTGTQYTFTTCGDNDFDTQLTLYNAAGGAALAFNDDGGGCGVQSTITWTSTITGTVWILLDQYFCANASTACMNLSVTQNTACTNFPPCNGLCPPGGTPPAEDDCFTALNLGTMPTPPACTGITGGQGIPIVYNLSNVCATPSNPYTFMSNCADGTDMAAPALDVWYQVTISGSQLIVTLEAGMNTPALGLWRDVGLGCAGLQPAGCTTGAAGYANEVFGPLFPGTYYLQISGGDLGDQCDFLLTLQNNNSCADCLVGQNLTATPPPDGGIYPPGTTVTFCYTLNDYNDAAAINWIHGVVPVFGDGWDLSTLTPQPIANPAGCGTGQGVGTWAWYNNPVTGQNGSSAQTTSVGPGFFHESNFGCPGACNPANPGDNWGDNLGQAGCSLVFCWNITSLPAGAACVDQASLNVFVETYADSETGSWTMAGCQNDPDLDFYATLNCCDVNGTVTNNGPLCVGENLQLGVNVTTPGTNITYEWSGPDGYTSTLQNPVINNLPINLGGYYSVIVTVDGCISIPLFTFVDLYPQPDATASNSGAVCPGGSVTLSASSTSAGVTGYSWTGPNGYTSTQQNPVITATAANAGTYSVVSVDANGCSSAPATTTVSLLPVPNATASNTGPVCAGGLAVLNANTATPGVATYQWSGPNGFTSTDQSPFFNNATAANAGVYTVTITVGGCSSTPATTTLVVNPIPTATAGNTGPACLGGSVTLQGSTTTPGTATYQWSGPNGFTSSQQNPVINGITAAAAGTYSVTVTVNGCPSTPATTTVTINSPPNATASNDGPACPGDDITLTATTTTPGTATYQWSGPGGFSSTQQNPVLTNVTTASGGVYSVTITVNGCASAPATTTVTINPVPGATAANNGPVCLGSNVTLTASTTTPGIATYAWTGPDGFTSTSANPVINGLTALQTGTYSVVITVNGCDSAPATTDVSLQSPPDATATNTGPACLGSSVTLNAATTVPGTTTYLWSGPNGFSSSLQNPVINPITAAAAGAYTVTVTVNGCNSAPASTTVAISAQPNATAGSNTPVCSGSDINLTASTTATGTTITYAWSGPNGFASTQQNPVVSAATAANSGTYTLIVTVDGCASNPVTTDVTVNALPNATAGNSGAACLGTNVTLNAGTTTPGTATYSWTGPNGFNSALQNPVINGVTLAAAGTYTVSVTVAGCTATAGTTVTINPQPNATATNSGTCAGSALTLIGSTSTPGTTIVYAWTGPNGFVSAQQSPVIAASSTLDAGVYTLIVTVDGCPSQAVTTTVTIDNPPSAVVNSTPAPVCNTSSGGSVLDFNTLITGGDFGGSWTDVSGSGASGVLPFLNFNGVVPGNYTFTYTTNSAIPPCIEADYTVTVVVEDCACPSVATAPPAPICNSSGVLNLQTIQLTSEPGAWTITSAPPGANPATIIGNILDATNANPGTYILTFSLTNAPPAGCPVSSVQSLVVGNAVDAGNDNNIEVCNSNPAPVDLNSLLSGADPGGTWQLAVFSPVPNPGTFVPATGTFFTNEQPQGNYTFEYVVPATTPCPVSVAQITVSVYAQPDATITNPNPTVCNTTSGGSGINLNTLLAPGASAGIWVDAIGNTVANPNLDFNGFTPGSYDYFYTTTNAIPPCINTNFGVTVIVEDCACPSVALSAPPALCNNSGTLNLSTIQVTTQPGTWTLTTTPPGATSPATLTGTTFNATGATPGTYQVTYTLAPAPPAGCPASASQNISVVAAPNAGTGGTATVCNTQTTPVILSDLLTGASGGGTWALTGGTANAGAFNAATGQFNPNGHPPVTLNFTYTLTGTTPCPNATTSVTVNVTAAPNAGTSGTLDICNTETNLIQLSDIITGEDATGAWALTSGVATPGAFNAATGTFNPNGHPSATLVFTYTVPAAGACAASTSTATINVFAAALAGTGSTQSVCNSQITLIDLSGGLTGESGGGTWSVTGGTPDAGAFDAASATFAPNGHTPGSYTFTYTQAASGTCPASTATVQIQVVDQPAATVIPNANICNLSADGSVLDLSALVTGGNTSGTWSEVTASGVSLANPASVDFNGVAAGTYTFTYNLPAVVPCTNPAYAVNVLVQDCSCPSVAITTPAGLCNDLGTLDLTTLELTPEDGDWTITSTPAGTNPAFLVGPTVNAIGADAGVYTITFTLATPPPAGCLPSASENLQVSDAANAGNGTDLQVCNNSTTPVTLSAQLSGADAGGAWSVTAGTPDAGAFIAATGTFNPDGHTPGDITFAYTVNAAAPCTPDVETVTISVIDAVSAGIGGNISLCNSEPTILDLFGLLGGATSGGTWTATGGTPDAGAFNAATGTFNPNGHSPGVFTFTYSVTGNGPCINDSEDVVITINNALNAGFDTTVDICNDTATPLTLLSQLTGADAGGIWTVSASSPDNPGAGSFNAATGVFNPAGQPTGTYVFTYSQPAVGDCDAVSANVTVNITDAPAATVTPGGTTCNSAADGSVLNLSGLVTAGITTGTWEDTDGTGVDLTNPSAVDFDGIAPGTYTFTYTIGGSGTCPQVSYTAEIVVEDCSCPSVATIPPVAALCNSSALLDLATLQITTQPGTWSITATPPGATAPATIATGTTNFDATGATPGNYTVTFTLTTPPPAGCPPASSQNITVNGAVIVGTGGSTDVCNDAATTVDLNGLLTGANPGGTWTVLSGGPNPAAVNLAAGTFNTNAHPAGTYQFQYTITGSGTGACATDFASVTVNVSAALTATVTPSANVCNTTADGSVLNFNSFITSGSTLGVWQDTGGSGVSLANLAAVDFNGVAAGNYVFTYTLDSAAPCADSAPTITVTVEDCSCPSVAISAPADLCNDAGTLDLSTLQVTTEAGTWTITNVPVGANPATLTGTLFNAAGSDAGDYEITFTLNTAPPAGCPASSVQTITVFHSGTAGTGSSDNVCNAAGSPDIDLATLLSNADLAGTWAVNATSPQTPQGAAFNAGAGTFNPDAQTPGTYEFSYTISNQSPCVNSTAVVTIVVEDCNCIDPPAPVAVTALVEVCEGEVNTTAFEVTTAPNTTVNWYDAPTGGNLLATDALTYLATTAGTYYAEAVNNPDDGCASNRIEFTLTENTIPVADFTAPAATCTGTALSISFTGSAGAGATYNWDFGTAGTQTGAGPHTVTWNAAGTQTITLVVSNNGCDNIATADILVSGVTATASASPVSAGLGDTITLAATGVSASGGQLTYAWSAGTGTLSCTDCPNPVTVMEGSSTYTVTITDDAGCSDVATADVALITEPPVENTVLIPNAFSPNGDNVNDVFRLSGLNVQEFELIVHNRWGIQVYSIASTNLAEGWDGTYKGKDQEVGVYGYWAVVTFTDGEEKMFKGNVTLVR